MSESKFTLKHGDALKHLADQPIVNKVESVEGYLFYYDENCRLQCRGIKDDKEVRQNALMTSAWDLFGAYCKSFRAYYLPEKPETILQDLLDWADNTPADSEDLFRSLHPILVRIRKYLDMINKR